MPTFKLDDDSVSRGQILARRLLSDSGMVMAGDQDSGFGRRRLSQEAYADVAHGAPIADVLENTAQMAMEFEIMRRWESEVPCATVAAGEVIPISVAPFLGGATSRLFVGPDWPDRLELSPRALRQVLKGVLQQMRDMVDNVQLVEVPRAVKLTERNLTAFLSYRFDGMKKAWPWIRRWPRPVPRRPGLRIRVSCRTYGLRLHVSDAYFISWVFFGSPTTPVSGYVLPGRYIFAGDGPMLRRLTVDPGVFAIPPTFRPALMRF